MNIAPKEIKDIKEDKGKNSVFSEILNTLS